MLLRYLLLAAVHAGSSAALKSKGDAAPLYGFVERSAPLRRYAVGTHGLQEFGLRVLNALKSIQIEPMDGYMKSNWICAFLLAAILAISGCGGGGGSSPGPGGGGGGGNPIPVVSPTAGATTSPTSEAAYTCPTSDTSSSAVPSASFAAKARRMPLRTASHAPAGRSTQLIAVSYERSLSAAPHRALIVSEARLGANLKREVDFPRIGLRTRILSVATAAVARTEAVLRAQPGVRSVGLTGGRRYPLAVTQPFYYPNNPYFTGFANPPAANGTTPPATFEILPYVENAEVPGQWGFHAAQFERAYTYSQPDNGSSVANANALGSPNVKIAIIDSGADLTQPGLAPNVAYQRCFITDPSDNTSTSNFVTDPDGHGTDVSGIADAVSNSGFGFAGAAGKSIAYEYRVDPTPDDDCSDATKSQNDNQCGATVQDVVSAIEDAVAQHVSVINMSLGSFASDGTSSGCTNGVDMDPDEANAVADALAANIVVVAAAGNGGAAAITAPACDAGVIAAGASALADGQPNGAKNSNGSAAAPAEYVASYSSYGSPGAAYRNPAAWGLVAPGGDPISNDSDVLHWIQNIYTSTPFSDADAGSCGADPYDPGAPATECQILIAGTSMAAPTIAGAAALILAVNAQYAAPGKMKTLFCTTADDLNDPHEGCGRLNIYRAMATALGDPVLP